MKRPPFPRSLFLLAGFSACSGSPGVNKDGANHADPTAEDTDANADTQPTSGDGPGTGDNPGRGTDPGDGTGNSDESGDESGAQPMDPPHALGTISLGEFRSAAGGSPSAMVSAYFVPTVVTPTTCNQEVAGCTIAAVAQCDGGCAPGQYCGFDENCEASCQRVCDAKCADGEVCYFEAPDQPACRAVETFDAGDLEFDGTLLPISLAAPLYSFVPVPPGLPPFEPGTELTVTAAGADDAGFEAFERTFTATDLMQTELTSITPDEAFGDGDVAVTWTPGTDEVSIVVTVQGGGQVATVTCAADDASGQFDVPRQAITAGLDGAALSTLSLSVTRTRREVSKDLTTKGRLTGVEVEPVGWLHLETRSTESISIQECPAGTVFCEGLCQSLDWNPDHCGVCGRACGPDQACEAGDCVGGASNDPNYPPSDGGCPGGGLALETTCAPRCGVDDSCAEPDSGTSLPYCGWAPTSSADPCTIEGSPEECPGTEICEANTSGGLQCFGAATHCVLACDNTLRCPDGMNCDPIGICLYP